MDAYQNGLSPLSVGVIGCGRMGKLHARTYSKMPQVKLVGVCDADPVAAAAVANEFNCAAWTEIDQLLPQVDAVTIATPTQYHAAVAAQCLKSNVACLIEKPLARDAAECQKIADLARACGVTVQVGHIERFNPAMRALAKLEIQPRFIETVRISPMTFRSLDVGVVLDMMIHDLDLVLKLAGSAIARVEASGVAVAGGAEDICNARLTFENGCVANLTASRLALKTERKLRVFSPQAFVSIDFGKRSGAVVRGSSNLPTLRHAAEQVRKGQIKDMTQLKYIDLIKVEPLEIEEKDQLLAQAESFISAVRNRVTPEVSVTDGAAAVATAERILAAIVPQQLMNP